MKEVLVTGGGGYIGSTLIRLLLERGYKVKVLDRFFFGLDSIKDIKDKVQIIKDDIRFVREDVFKDVYAVLDLAALSNDPTGEIDPQKTLDINFLGRVRVALLAKRAGVKRYVLASSCSVYGFQNDILFEDSPVNPLTTYAEANYLAEQSIIPFSSDKFVVTVLRQATVYGFSYRMRFDLAINAMVLSMFKTKKLKVMRDGQQWRPFVHVKDTSKAFITVLESDADKVNGQIFNVGSNEQNIKIIDLAKKVADTLGIPLNIEWYGDPDKRSYRVNFDKIKNVLGYKPDHSFEDGIKEVYRALAEGKISDDDKTRTVVWYRNLIKWKEILDDVLYKGEIL